MMSRENPLFFFFFPVWLVFGLHHAHHRVLKDEGLNFSVEGEKR